MRLFIAIPVGDKIKETVSQWMIKTNLPGKKVSIDNLHFTLAFLGERSEDEILIISNNLKEVLKSTSAFHIELEGVDAFPKKENPRIVFIKVKEGKNELCSLANKIDDILPAYTRDHPFKPHLTVARLKENAFIDKRRVEEIIRLDGNYSFSRFKAEEVILFSSNLRAEGPYYTPLTVCSLVD